MGRTPIALLAVLATALVAVATGCTPAADPEPAPGAATSPTAPLRTDAAEPACPDPLPTEAGLLELRGTVPGDGEVWALLFGDHPARAGREIKIAWRMTGEGPLSLSATGPAGRRIAPLWGPEPHGGSSWDRPGDEWGSGWKFPAPGCWTVHLVRGTERGRAGIRVVR